MAGRAYSSNIIDLREVSPDHWQAKYQGNFGVYTIKINTDGKSRSSFSCSCPSDYYPCKHIPVVEEAIAERIAKNANSGESGKGFGMSVEELLGKLTHKELFDFTARLVRNNPDLTSAVFLTFSEKIEYENGNKYLMLIRGELENVRFTEDDYYSEYDISIDALDRWAERAEQYLEEGKPGEAVLIAQAYLEEFARWLDEIADGNVIDYIPEDYQTRPFEILEKIILEKADGSPQVNTKDIYDYCVSEMAKDKYADWYMLDCFHDLLAKLAVEVDPKAFIQMQEDLLNGIEDKSSSEAEKILRRIIDFYRSCQKPKTAWKQVKKNIQITRFRKMVIEKRIKQKKFAEAKTLVQDYLDAHPDTYRRNDWDDYLLQIAQGENDIPAIQSITYSFIKDFFRESYYRIYQSAFSAGEWPEQFENLLQHYNTQSNGNDNAAELLAAERMAERLLEHIKKNPSLKNLEKYYSVFAAAFPAETLALFRTAADRYMEANTGRGHYEYIVSMFKKMERIPGGSEVTADMTRVYLTRYKNRRAMIEILNKRSKRR